MPQGEDKREKENPQQKEMLPFKIEYKKGKNFLILNNHKFLNYYINELVLEAQADSPVSDTAPSLSFLKNAQTSLVSLDLEINLQENIENILLRHPSFFKNIKFDISEQDICVSGTYEKEKNISNFTFKCFLHGSSDRFLTINAYDFRIYGYLDILIYDLFFLLMNSSKITNAEFTDITTYRIDPCSTFFNNFSKHYNLQTPLFDSFKIQKFSFLNNKLKLSGFSGEDVTEYHEKIRKNLLQMLDAKSIYRNAEKHLYEKEYDKVTQIYEQELAKKISHPFLVERLLRLYETNNNYENKAINLAQNFLKKNKNFGDALNILGSIYYKNKDLEKSKEYFTKLYNLNDKEGNLEDLIFINILLGKIYLDKDLTKSLNFFQRAIAFDSENMEALFLTAITYEELGRTNQAVSTLSKIANISENKDEQYYCYFKIGAIYVKTESNLQKSTKFFKIALEINPQGVDAIDGLANSYVLLGNPEKAISLYENELQKTSNKERIANIHYNLGEIWETNLKNIPNAILRYQESYSMNPSFIPALEKLSALYQSLNEYEKAAKILEKLVELYAKDKKKTKIVSTANATQKIFEAKLKNPVKAYYYHLTSFTWNSDNKNSFIELVAKAKALRVENKLYEELFNLRNVFDSKKEALIYLKNVAEFLSKDKLEISKHFIKELLLTDIFNESSLRFSIKFYEDFGAINELIDVLLGLEKIIKDPHEIAELKFILGSIYYSKLNDSKQALSYLKESLEIKKENPKSINILHDILVSLKKTDEFLGLLSELKESSTDITFLAFLNLKIADIYKNELKDYKKALDLYERLFATSSTNEKVFKSILESLIRLEDTETFIKFFDNPLTSKLSTTYQEKILKDFLVCLRKKGLDNFEIKYLKRLLTINPDNDECINRLDSILIKKQEFKALMDFYEDIFKKNAPTSFKTKFLARTFEVSIKNVFDFKKAYNILKNVLKHKKDDLPIFLEKLADIKIPKQNQNRIDDLFEKLIKLQMDSKTQSAILLNHAKFLFYKASDSLKATLVLNNLLSKYPETLEAIDLLSDIYLKKQDFKKHLFVLEKKQWLITDPAQKSSLYCIMGEISSARLNDNKKAIKYLDESLNYDHTNANSLYELERIYAESESWDELLILYDYLIKLSKDNDFQISLFIKKSIIYSEKLYAFNKAKKSLENAHRKGADDIFYNSKIQEIESKQSKLRGDFERLVDAARTSDDTDAKKESISKLAHIIANNIDTAKEFINKKDILNLIREFLDLFPNKISTVSGLKDLFVKENDHESYIDFLFLEKSHVGADKLPSIDFELGKTYITKLKNIEEGIKYLTRALSEDVTLVSHLEEITNALEASQEWESLISINKIEFDFSDNAAKKGNILFSIANIYHLTLNNFKEAFAFYDKALIANANLVPSFIGIYKKLKEEGQIEQAIKLMDVAASASSTSSLSSGIIIELIDIYYNHLKDVPNTVANYRKALEKDLGLYPTLINFRTSSKEDIKYELLKIEENLLVNNMFKSQVLYELGKFLIDAKEHTRGLEYLNNALNLNHDHIPSLIMLANTFLEMKDFETSEKFLLKLIELVAKEESYLNHGAILTKLGHLSELQGDDDMATIRYRSAIQINEKNPVPWEKLAGLYLKQKNYSQALIILKEFLNLVKPEIDKSIKPYTKKDYNLSDIYYEIALCEEKLGDYNNAIINNIKSLTYNEKHVRTKLSLGNLYFKLNKWKDAQKVYLDLLELPLDEKQKIHTLTNIISCLENTKDSSSKIIDFAYEILLIEPENLFAVLKLKDIYVGQKDFKNAVRVLQDISKRIKDKEKLIVIFTELGNIHKMGLNDSAGALKYFKSALSLDPYKKDILEKLITSLIASPRRENIEKISVLLNSLEKQNPNLAENYRIKIARMFSKDHKSIPAAITLYEEILKQKEDANLETELARCYILIDQVDNAINRYVQILTQNPFDLSSCEEAANLLKKNNLHDRAFCFFEVLACLDMKNVEAREFLYETRDKYLKITPKPITKTLRTQYLVHKNETNLIGKIFKSISNIIATIFEVEGAMYDSLADSSRPQDESFKKIQYLFKASHIKLLYAKAGRLGVYPENTTPPTILFNSKLSSKFSKSEKRFLFAKNIYHILNSHHVFKKLTAQNLSLLLNFLCNLICKTKLPLSKTMNPNFRKKLAVLKKELDTKTKADTKDYLREYSVHRELFKISDWLEAREHSANRAGLLASNDLSSSINCIIKFDRKLSKLDFKERVDFIDIFSKSRMVTELLRYNISSDFAELREKVGIVIR